jgi:hypothetical protein
MAKINFDLGLWPSDVASQRLFINQLMNQLGIMNTFVNERTSDFVEITQATEPTQDEWELAWLQQTGKQLPISKNAVLHWIDTVTGDLGGVYGVLLDSTNVLRKDSKYVRGGIGFFGSAQDGPGGTGVAFQIGEKNSEHSSLTFTLNQSMDLELTYQLYVSLTSGAGSWGADFLLDGSKVGTDLLGINLNMGIVNTEIGGLVYTTIIVPNVEAGEHTVQAIFGYTGIDATPPSLDFGQAADGILLLTVKGIIS